LKKAGFSVTEQLDGMSIITAETAEDLAKIVLSKVMKEKVLPDNDVFTASLSTILVDDAHVVPMYSREK
jgi:hypothetical protein